MHSLDIEEIKDGHILPPTDFLREWLYALVCARASMPPPFRLATSPPPPCCRSSTKFSKVSVQ